MRIKKWVVSLLTASLTLVVLAVGVLVVLGTSCAFWSGPSPSAVAARVQRDVVYGRPAGVKLTMDLYFPPGKTGGPRPVVMYVHGGGWEMGSKSMVSVIPGPAELLRRGYVVAAINYRLAPQYQFPAMIEDVMGDSSGGHLAALLGLTDARAGFDGPCEWSNETSRVQAVVDLYGPTDLAVGAAHLSDFALSLMKTAFGVTNADSPVLQRASPVTYVSSHAPPFLILHGDHDDLVPLQQSRELYQKLKATVTRRLG
jgi:acetyl esterase/lipase